VIAIKIANDKQRSNYSVVLLCKIIKSYILLKCLLAVCTKSVHVCEVYRLCWIILNVRDSFRCTNSPQQVLH